MNRFILSLLTLATLASVFSITSAANTPTKLAPDAANSIRAGAIVSIQCASPLQGLVEPYSGCVGCRDYCGGAVFSATVGMPPMTSTVTCRLMVNCNSTRMNEKCLKGPFTDPTLGAETCDKSSGHCLGATRSLWYRTTSLTCTGLNPSLSEFNWIGPDYCPVNSTLLPTCNEPHPNLPPNLGGADTLWSYIYTVAGPHAGGVSCAGVPYSQE